MFVIFSHVSYAFYIKCLTSLAVFGALEKLRKVTISFVMSVRPSIHPHWAVRLPLEGFSRNLILEYISKICPNNLFIIIIVLLKYGMNNRYFT